MKTVVMTYGRFQPPTKMHGQLFQAMKVEADYWGCCSLVFMSPKQDHKNNPLSLETRKTYLWDCGRYYGLGKKNPFDAVCELGKAGYERVIFFCGSDQIKKYQTWSKYVKNPDPELTIPGVQELIFRQFGYTRGPMNVMSATTARNAAKVGDYQTFNSIVLGTDLEKNIQLFMDTISGIFDK